MTGVILLMRRTLSTCWYEIERSLTWQRLSLTLVLSLFPPAMLALILRNPEVVQNADAMVFFQFVLIFLVSIVCLLALLLWASTNVYSELEGKTWIFMASRPQGRVSMLLGKFLAAFFQATVVSTIAITLSISLGSSVGAFDDPAQTWISLIGIFALAGLAYSAIFSLIGTLFYRRAMVICAGYVLLGELFLANVPALISRFTARYHLQEIGFRWVGFFLPVSPDEYRALFAPQPQWVHFTALSLIVVGCLTFACLFIIRREYLTSDET